MTADERTILLGHAADLRQGHHGLPLVADLIVKAVMELEAANDTIEALRKPMAVGGTE